MNTHNRSYPPVQDGQLDTLLILCTFMPHTAYFTHRPTHATYNGNKTKLSHKSSCNFNPSWHFNPSDGAERYLCFPVQPTPQLRLLLSSWWQTLFLRAGRNLTEKQLGVNLFFLIQQHGQATMELKQELCASKVCQRVHAEISTHMFKLDDPKMNRYKTQKLSNTQQTNHTISIDCMSSRRHCSNRVWSLQCQQLVSKVSMSSKLFGLSRSPSLRTQAIPQMWNLY